MEEDPSSSSSSTDRLSSLDLNLRLHILSFLPYKSAITTSLLSSTWRDLWLRRWAHPLSHLRLLSDLHVSSFLSLSPLPPRLDSLHLLLLRPPRVHRVLDVASSLQLQDLSISAAAAGEISILPLPPSLARLSLSGIHLGSPVQNLSFLEHLNLHSVSLSDETLAKTVSGLYLLKTLDLRRCRGLYRVRVPGNGLWLRNVVLIECFGVARVRIEAKSVKRFHFVGEFCDYVLESLMEVEMEDVYMSCGGKDPMLPTTRWWTLLGRPWFVRVLTLCDASLRVRSWFLEENLFLDYYFELNYITCHD